MDDTARALSFGKRASHYDRWRPGYPIDAVRWMLPAHSGRVIDVGAGTGKLTRVVLELGYSVTAVEPDEAMVAVLHESCPTADVASGSAERLPIDDGSAVAVVVGQAWHWFRPERALAEARRVTRPGGRLGLIWNTPLGDVPWAAEVAAVNPGHVKTPGLEVEHQAPGLPVDQLEVARFIWNWPVTPDQVAGCMSTHSAFIAMDPDVRDRRLQHVRTIAEHALEGSSSPRLMWPHESYCVRLTL